ncbi:MAG: radical SAM protein, partial [Propionibacteriaceae bacterium]|nr:radical SAM protein [Propionibacteriaceae bacterium]
MEHWFDRTEAGRVEWAQRLGLPRFRARQLDTHLFSRLEDSPDEWTDIPKPLREKLQAECLPPLLAPVTTLTADQGATVKSLWRLPDGVLVEGVLMRYGVKGLPASGRGDERATLCLSCQAGCAMGCPFCATGQGGLQRNLTCGEIVAQVADAAGLLARGEVAGGPGQVGNIVLMGMGEPLANYDAVLAAIRTLARPQPDGYGMSPRGITLSTVGLVPRIARLAEEELPITLAVSLHAPDDGLRDELIPVNQRWKV